MDKMGRSLGVENGNPLQYYFFFFFSTPVFLTKIFHGQSGLVGYSLWGHKVRHDCVTQHTYDDSKN